jgi:hypothetical protein
VGLRWSGEGYSISFSDQIIFVKKNSGLPANIF